MKLDASLALAALTQEINKQMIDSEEEGNREEVTVTEKAYMVK